MDVHTREQRSYNMSRIKNVDTKPEIRFRKYIWNQGLKGYRLKSKINGKPDLFFSRQKVAVFIDGCFWHKCPVCFTEPKSNRGFWSEKISKNTLRDIQVSKTLSNQGILVLRFWEHEIEKDLVNCYKKLRKGLSD